MPKVDCITRYQSRHLNIFEKFRKLVTHAKGHLSVITKVSRLRNLENFWGRGNPISVRDGDEDGDRFPVGDQGQGRGNFHHRGSGTRISSKGSSDKLSLSCHNVKMRGDSLVSAFPEEDNIFCWKWTITGIKDTVFEGIVYKLSLSFPNDFPFKPPKIKFETACFHPNVDLYGNICLDILQGIIG
ncbi:hypothetical protein HYC85_031171 [Camellia sinensis]|uniref:UBC core domain-containing protein n=1 Tax=Camellia sinensis TaxID=4442 RepID=A0A7J7FRL6_CAMSI|nr:hypothetical protein HYC85_031171 [Camellia sinensis]